MLKESIPAISSDSSKSSISQTCFTILPPKLMIFHALVAKQNEVLVECQLKPGNFSGLSKLLLARIPAQNSRMSYSYDNFYFHYLRNNEFTYLCLSKDTFSRKLVFEFLEELERDFKSSYLVNVDLQQQFGPKLQLMLEKYQQPTDNLTVLKDEVEQVRKLMTQNIGTLY